MTPGTEFRLAPRLMTRERMRWYVDIQETVQQDTGRIVTQPPTIHDDDAYAKKQGLPGIIADGMSNKLIARELDIAEGTVKVHVKHLLKKLNLRSRVEAAVWADRSRRQS